MEHPSLHYKTHHLDTSQELHNRNPDINLKVDMLHVRKKR